MRVDQFQQALREAAAEQPPVSPHARDRVAGRIRRRRAWLVVGAGMAVAAVGGVGAIVVPHSTDTERVATHPATSAVAPTPTSAPEATTTPTTSDTTSTAPAGALPPPGFSPVSVTFVSARTGWALGTSKCANDACPAFLVRTGDGGATWTSITPPPVPVVKLETPGVRQVRFANLDDGWAFGPDLWATHDGGRRWSHLDLGLPASAEVFDLAAANGVAHVVAFADGQLRILTSPVGQDRWQPSPTTIPIGAGPVPSATLVLQGQTGWLIENDRTVVGGARLDHGGWVAWSPPCADSGGPADLGASSPTDVAVICHEGQWNDKPMADRVFLSTDAGSTFRATATLPPQPAGVVATPARGTVVVGVAAQSGPAWELARTTDAGVSWSVVHRESRTAGQWLFIGFTTPTTGVAIKTGGGGSSSLLRTTDGGRSWSVVAFHG